MPDKILMAKSVGLEIEKEISQILKNHSLTLNDLYNYEKEYEIGLSDIGDMASAEFEEKSTD